MFYSNMIMMQINNISFYKKETVQKLIDFQFNETQSYLKWQFWFYFCFFVVPYSVNVVSEDK